MVCLRLVLVPALVLAIKGIKVSLTRLIFPALGALLLAAFLLSRWKMLAIQSRASKMETEPAKSPGAEI